MNTVHNARKIRQFEAYSKKLNKLIGSGQLDSLSNTQLHRLKVKINRLYAQVSHMIHTIRLQKIVGAAWIFLCFSSVQESRAQTFAPGVVNPFGLTSVSTGANLPVFTDLDGDGDLDVLTLEAGGAFMYFENTGTVSAPAFGAPVTNPFQLSTLAEFSGKPTLADLDNDGDLDLMVGIYTGVYYADMRYYENTGNSTAPAFAAPVSAPFGILPGYYHSFPVFGDLDQDGDYDIINGGYYGEIFFHENTGSVTAPAFSNNAGSLLSLSDANFVAVPTMGDLDNDGDLDLLHGDGNALVYREDLSALSQLAQFATPVMSPFGLDTVANAQALTPTLGDLDNDGDLDLLVGTSGPGQSHFIYYENTSPLNVEVPGKNPLVHIAPNPVHDVLTIQYDNNGEAFTLSFYNLLGERVISENMYTIITKVSTADIAEGLYLLELSRKNGEVISTEKIMVNH